MKINAVKIIQDSEQINHFEITKNPSRLSSSFLSFCSLVAYFSQARRGDFLIILGLKSPLYIFFFHFLA